MKKKRKIVGIVIPVAVLAALAAGAHFWFSMRNQILDGPGMVYEWTAYELYSEWVEINCPPGREPNWLSVSEGKCTLTGADGNPMAFQYSLPDGTDTYGVPDGEVALQLAGCSDFDSLIFHEESLNENERIPILSGTAFEYDGRGEIVIAEFARSADLDRIPEDFRSSACIRRNDREAIPTTRTVGETDTADADGNDFE